MKKTILKLMAVSAIVANSSYAAVPTLALTFDTNVNTYSMTSSQEAKIQKAEYKIMKVIESETFRTKVLGHTYNGVKKFVDNGGYSNSQIYTKILEAMESYKKTKNNTMDLNIKVYYQNSSTVGYTTTTSSYINMNTKYLNTYTSNQVARNMMHEWLHKLGFKHAVSYSTSRNYSVPYAIGKIVETLAAKY
jgi:hypothetical protein